MRSALCLFFVFSYCAAAAVAPTRLYFPEEDDINFKRYLLLKDADGEPKMVDLLSEKVTARALPEHVTYYLYTARNLDNPYVITTSDASELSKSPYFNSESRTAFIIHGWVDNYTADVNQLNQRAILKLYDINVIVVDWSPIANENYITAMQAVTNIGTYIGTFVNDIIRIYGTKSSNFIIIGHSLGAHIAGSAGSTILGVSGSVDHIIGLDPAGPLFSVGRTDNRLDKSDAEYVQVIHTNGRLLGFASSIGHVDYYPNGGMVQAGCGLDLLGGCSHARAFQFLAESIEFENTSSRSFIATLCGSHSNYQAGRCANNRKIVMAEIDVDKTAVGDYYLITNSAAPFARS